MMREKKKQRFSLGNWWGWCLATALVCGAPAPSARAGIPVFADGFESGNTYGWDVSVGENLVPADAFRFSDLDLRDPHVFIDVPLVGCFDFTDTPLPANLAPSFNQQLETAITTDGDLDGFLDASFLLLFRPLDVLAAGVRLDTGSGLCTAPLASTSCVRDPASVPQTRPYDGMAAGVCLTPLAGTTTGYVPAVVEPSAPCFVQEALAAVVDFAGVPVTLTDVQVAATFVGAGVTELTPGLERGFLSEADADSILLPATLPLVGGQPLSVLLPGGMGNCSAGDDRDMHAGESGWWFYFNFDAETVPFTDN